MLLDQSIRLGLVFAVESVQSKILPLRIKRFIKMAQDVVYFHFLFTIEKECGVVSQNINTKSKELTCRRKQRPTRNGSVRQASSSCRK